MVSVLGPAARRGPQHGGMGSGARCGWRVSLCAVRGLQGVAGRPGTGLGGFFGGDSLNQPGVFA
jgi:hypothetical protein